MRCWPVWRRAKCSARRSKVISAPAGDSEETQRPPHPRPRPLEIAEGNAMELLDCGFPPLADVIVTDQPDKAFAGVNWATRRRRAAAGRAWNARICSASTARSSSARARRGEERRQRCSDSIVGNPCNTNCLVASSKAAVFRRALDGDDAPGPQPRRVGPGTKGGGPQRGGDVHDHLGEPQQHAVPRLHQCENQR